MKNTKKALTLSVLAMVLCLSMLVGSTFAWFTDSASTNVNTIQAGTLDIDLVDGSGATVTGRTLKFSDLDSNDLWEPGCTYNLENIYIVNKGNLALKYKVVITGINGSAKLNEAIEWTINGADANTEYHLLPGAQEMISISGHMKEDAGNEYQGLKIDGIAITVMAAQDTVEYDSNNNTYDENAIYDNIVFATSQEEVINALTNASTEGKTVINAPAGNLTLSAPLTNKDVTISGTKETVIDTTVSMPNTRDAVLTFEGVTINFKENGSYGTNGFTHSDKVVYKDCVINATQFLYSDAEFINCTFNVTGDAYAVWTYGASNVTFTNCTFNTSGKAILVYIEAAHTATINVTNCTFNSNGNTYNKAAIEVGESANGNKANYTLNITNSTADAGFTANNSTSNLWGNKNDMGTSLNVILDGTDVH